ACDAHAPGLDAREHAARLGRSKLQSSGVALGPRWRAIFDGVELAYQREDLLRLLRGGGFAVHELPPNVRPTLCDADRREPLLECVVDAVAVGDGDPFEAGEQRLAGTEPARVVD